MVPICAFCEFYSEYAWRPDSWPAWCQLKKKTITVRYHSCSCFKEKREYSGLRKWVYQLGVWWYKQCSGG